MKLSEFKSLIREEIRKVIKEENLLKESTVDDGMFLKLALKPTYTKSFRWCTERNIMEIWNDPKKAKFWIAKFKPLWAKLEKYKHASIIGFFLDKGTAALDAIEDKMLTSKNDTSLDIQFEKAYKVVSSQIALAEKEN